MKRLVRIPALLLAMVGALSLSGCELNFLVNCFDDSTSSITIHNVSGHEIAAVYICDPESSSWGGNVLDGTTLYDGDRITIRDLPPGRYDLYAESWDGDGGGYWEEDGMLLTSGGLTWKIR